MHSERSLGNVHSYFMINCEISLFPPVRITQTETTRCVQHKDILITLPGFVRHEATASNISLIQTGRSG